MPSAGSYSYSRNYKTEGETIPKMQTIVEHFIRYEMFWQCSLLHSTLRTYYVYVFEFMRYFKLKINLKA